MGRKQSSGKNYKKIRNMFGIISVLSMLAAAFLLPELYFSYYDRSNEGQVEYLDAQMDTYQIQYEDFGKKLEALGEYNAEGTELSAVLLQETTDLDTQMHLTEAVNREFGQMWEYGAVWDTYDCYITDLRSCSLYTAYPVDGGEEPLKGFVFWKLVYEMEGSFEIRVLLDTEFEKIISYYVWNEDIQRNYEIWTKEMSINKSQANISCVDGGIVISQDHYGKELVYYWGEGMFNYYGLNEDFYAGWREDGGMEKVESVSRFSETEEQRTDKYYIGEYVYWMKEDWSAVLNLEYYLGREGDKGYYAVGISCFNDFLQL